MPTVQQLGANILAHGLNTGVQSQGLSHIQRENSSLVRALLLGQCVEQCGTLTHEDLCLLVVVVGDKPTLIKD